MGNPHKLWENGNEEEEEEEEEDQPPFSPHPSIVAGSPGRTLKSR
jgi:hypothetical protein